MTELEKMQRARMYLDKLAEGVNPLDDSPLPEGDIVNNVRITRCLHYVSDVLRQVMEQGGIGPQENSVPPNGKRIPFRISAEALARYPMPGEAVPISEITKRINSLINTASMRQLSHTVVTSWLVEQNFLCVVTHPDGRTSKRPTENGLRLGISEEERMGQYGEYHAVLYSPAAQRFILQNLPAMLEKSREKGPETEYECEGQPWDAIQDELLLDLLNKRIPVAQMTTIFQRSESALRSRIRRLALAQSGWDIR